MKFLVVSDIHGVPSRLDAVLDFYRRESYDMMLILGDMLNYGPRNGVPEGLDAMGVVERLNAMAGEITAIRGNCDSEVDQMLLEFPMMADCSSVCTTVGGKNVRIFLTHGHIFSPDNRPAGGIDIFFSGHTHLWELRRESDGTIVCNTGSITFPKGGNEPTFATIEHDGTVCIRNLCGEILSKLSLE